MSGFDKGQIYSAQVLAGSESSRAADQPAHLEQTLFDFVQRFRQGNDYIYRDRLRANLLAKQHVLEVSLEHVGLWNERVAQQLGETPGEVLPLVSNITTSTVSLRPATDPITALPFPLAVRRSCQASSSSHPLPSLRRWSTSRRSRLSSHHPLFRKPLVYERSPCRQCSPTSSYPWNRHWSLYTSFKSNSTSDYV